jgi:predicted transcriptional regulator of viral defense system
MVMTVQKPRDRSPKIKGVAYMLRTVSEKALFGLRSVWRGQVKISVSDPTRTILDMLSDPVLGGGIRSTRDMFTNYLRSENKNLGLLIDYSAKLGNGAVFKRLGFLLELVAPDETEKIEQCRARLTAGNAKLDPNLNNERLITGWRLWVPENWKRVFQPGGRL